MAPTLIITVDTEEEFDWNAPPHTANRSVAHAGELSRLQNLFEEYGARPTYVVDHPIATTESSVNVLKGFLDRGMCEIGAHLHPWVNPPIEEEVCPKNTYLCNLPPALREEKLGVLTDAIRSAFGDSPTTFKAGRYGFHFDMAASLVALGYTVDTSVIAYMDSSDGLGPSFARVGNQPFWIPESATANGNGAGRLLEVPCTVGFTRRPFATLAGIHRRLATGLGRRLRAVGILWRLGILRKIVFSPEGYAARDLKRLARTMARDRDVVLNLTLHSPSVQPGNTPYVRTSADLDVFFANLRSVLEFCVRSLGARCLTLREYHQHLIQTQSP
jgi:hypothetical protein